MENFELTNTTLPIIPVTSLRPSSVGDGDCSPTGPPFTPAMIAWCQTTRSHFPDVIHVHSDSGVDLKFHAPTK